MFLHHILPSPAWLSHTTSFPAQPGCLTPHPSQPSPPVSHHILPSPAQQFHTTSFPAQPGSLTPHHFHPAWLSHITSFQPSQAVSHHILPSPARRSHTTSFPAQPGSLDERMNERGGNRFRYFRARSGLARLFALRRWEGRVVACPTSPPSTRPLNADVFHNGNQH